MARNQHPLSHDPAHATLRQADTLEAMHTQSVAAAACILLAGCAAVEPTASTAADERSSTNAQVAQSVTTPLSDLNLVRADIPAVLTAAQKAPYAIPADRSCAALGSDIRALDAVLGADLDVVVTGANPSLIERGAGTVGTAAVGALRGAAEGVVPFRGWVRKLTGAERYSREVAAAITAGSIRRAYLKGLGVAGQCAAPAAPAVPTAPAASAAPRS
jgi:hypothetical protein